MVVHVNHHNNIKTYITLQSHYIFQIITDIHNLNKWVFQWIDSFHSSNWCKNYLFCFYNKVENYKNKEVFIREEYVFVCNLTHILKKFYIQIFNTYYYPSILWYLRNRWKCLEGSLLSTALSFVISKHRMIWQYYLMS